MHNNLFLIKKNHKIINLTKLKKERRWVSWSGHWWGGWQRTKLPLKLRRRGSVRAWRVARSLAGWPPPLPQQTSRHCTAPLTSERLLRSRRPPEVAAASHCTGLAARQPSWVRSRRLPQTKISWIRKQFARTRMLCELSGLCYSTTR